MNREIYKAQADMLESLRKKCTSWESWERESSLAIAELRALAASAPEQEPEIVDGVTAKLWNSPDTSLYVPPKHTTAATPEPVFWAHPLDLRSQIPHVTKAAWASDLVDAFTVPLYAYKDHTTADAPLRSEENKPVQSVCGVPDVAELVAALRDRIGKIGVDGRADYYWPLPNLHDEAADALTSLHYAVVARDARIAELEAMCKGMAAEGDHLERLNDAKDARIKELEAERDALKSRERRAAELLRNFNYGFGDSVDKEIQSFLEERKP